MLGLSSSIFVCLTIIDRRSENNLLMVKLSNMQLSTIKAYIVFVISNKPWVHKRPSATGNPHQLMLKVLLLATLNFGLTGCIKVDTSTRTPTIGAELIDLARAKELGMLSDEECNRMRRKVLASF